MLNRYDVVEIEDALRGAASGPPFPTVADRAAWDAIRQALGQAEVARIVARAEEDAQAPLPTLTATLYLDFLRTGARDKYERPAHRRREMLWNLTLAECLENQGRCLDPILDVAWAICEESSWAWPAHQSQLTDMHRPVLDLSVAGTALVLAELDLLLGRRLDPALGHRIRAEVDRRCLTPYLARHDMWWLHGSGRPNHELNNWTAVCNGGIIGAALYLEPDPARLAEIVARGLRSLDDYLDTFDPDGGSAEGPGYWSYGFGYFTILAHLVEHRTAGQIRLLDGDRIRQIASFPLRTVLSPGQFLNFSDCDLHVTLTAPHLAFLGRRLESPDLVQLASEQRESFGGRESTWGLRDLVWRPDPAATERFVPPRHDWLSGQMWMVARVNPGDAAALVLAAKGGHNGEPHNQNDVGSFIAHVGGESLVADPGRGRYTRFYFGPERYQHLVCTSRGHSVPVPNGVEQAVGLEYHATLLDHRSDDHYDRLMLELKDAYPVESDLASLRRTLTLQRDQPGGTIELTDAVRFASGPGRLESVLITFGQVEIGPAHVVLHGEHAGLRVGFDPEVVKPRVELEPQVDLAEGPTDLRRVVFELTHPAASAAIRLLLQPLVDDGNS